MVVHFFSSNIVFIIAKRLFEVRGETIKFVAALEYGLLVLHCYFKDISNNYHFSHIVSP
jgi:hypothetical protein